MSLIVKCDWCKAEMREIGHEYGFMYVYKCTKCHHEAGFVNTSDKLEDSPYMAALKLRKKQARTMRLLWIAVDLMVLSAWIWMAYLIPTKPLTALVPLVYGMGGLYLLYMTFTYYRFWKTRGST